MKVLIIAETKDGNLKKTGFELLAQAQHLNASATALLIGSGVSELAPKLGHYGAQKVLVADHADLAHYSTEAYAHVVAQAIQSENPDLVLFSASINGKDLAPRLSARLDKGLAADIMSLTHENGSFVAVRPMYAGKVMAKVHIQSQPALASIRPNVVAPLAPDASRQAEVVALNVSLPAARVKVVGIEKPEQGKLDVAEADIIVTGGRGLKGPENFHLVENLANAMGAAVGASRAVVDAGWRSHGEQVGQTGKTVSPSLYVAVAVSGAMQHMAGMSSSKNIVAINTDPDAPIFKVATYGMVADAFEVMPQFAEAVKKLKAQE